MCAYLPSDIVEVIQNPSMVNGRGIYTVEEMNKYWSNFQKETDVDSAYKNENCDLNIPYILKIPTNPNFVFIKLL